MKLSLPNAAEAVALTALVWESQTRSEGGNSADVSHLGAKRIALPFELTPRTGRRVSCASSAAFAVAPGSPESASSSASIVPIPPPARTASWFEVNAELIIYGRTERDAAVDRRRTLGEAGSDDGSFSFRFALPNGEFELPVVAVNAAEDDRRSAQLHFARTTQLVGDVGVPPAGPFPGGPGIKGLASALAATAARNCWDARKSRNVP